MAGDGERALTLIVAGLSLTIALAMAPRVVDHVTTAVTPDVTADLFGLGTHLSETVTTRHDAECEAEQLSTREPCGVVLVSPDELAAARNG